MEIEKKLGYLLVLMVSLSILSSFGVSAITAKIGNGKMILTVEVGDTVEKSIWVINDNEVAVDITLLPSGDLESDVQIIDNNFRLEPGEDKTARFKIPIKKEGKTETRINVKFTPVDGSQEVGLASQIIINAGNVDGSDDSEDSDENNKGTLIGNGILGSNGINNASLLLGLSTLFLAIVLIVLLYFSKKIGKKRKKVVNGGDGKRIKKEVEVK